MSTFEREMQINNAVVAQADENAKKSGYSTQQFYTVQVDENGEVSILSVDMDDIDASEGVTADMVFETPLRSGYLGYLVGDGIPPNGAPFGVGSGFPAESADGDYFLRNDFLPNRLFRFDGNSWQKVEDNDEKNTLLGTFINNTTVNTISGENVTERQALSKALRAKADN